MEIPNVDLRGLNPSSPGWGAACAAVTASMVAHGCVIIAYNTLSPELRQALFNRAMPELFAFPAETKQRNATTSAASKGYYGQLQDLDFESFNFTDVTDTRGVRDFSNLFWPQGNLEFCDTVMSFVSNALKLEHMVEKMILDGLGIREENIVALAAHTHSLRLSHYGAPEESKMGVTLPMHTDPTIITAIVQHEVEGLEVQAKDGSWITIPPGTDTITFIAGDLLTVITNGRVPACVHRVKTLSNRERFSVLFQSVGKSGAVVSAIDELVDRDHPLMYNPFKTDDYMAFRYSEEGITLSDPLKVFCGVHKCGST